MVSQEIALCFALIRVAQRGNNTKPLLIFRFVVIENIP